MAIGISPASTSEFILEREKEDDDGATVFVLRPMSTEDEAWITDQASQYGRVPLGQAMLKLVRSCVVGWRSFSTADGIALECTVVNGLLSDEAYRSIAREDRIELTYHIIGDGRIAPEQVQKSESQPTSSTATSKPAARPVGKAKT